MDSGNGVDDYERLQPRSSKKASYLSIAVFGVDNLMN